MNRAEVKSLNDKLETPAGEFKNRLTIEETSALESGRETKVYAPGIGLISEGTLKLKQAWLLQSVTKGGAWKMGGGGSLCATR